MLYVFSLWKISNISQIFMGTIACTLNPSILLLYNCKTNPRYHIIPSANVSEEIFRGLGCRSALECSLNMFEGLHLTPTLQKATVLFKELFPIHPQTSSFECDNFGNRKKYHIWILKEISFYHKISSIKVPICLLLIIY